jgi:non-specific serine/threonine protein kinase
MNRWATVKHLHQAALDREPRQRAAFLDDACAGDEALRREVESLLAYQTAAEPFMESPALEVTARYATQDRSSQLVGRTLGHYQVQSLLGAGGMGEVYLARDPRLERAVAVKILPPDLAGDADRMQRFTREAKAASALNHPNVATIHDIGETTGVQFIVMEYVEGQTLAARVAERPLTHKEIIDIGAQVADALDTAHSKGITHRDIKPANLMLTPRGQVKVLDFGIAKTARSEGAPPTEEIATGAQTAVGLVIGSVPYMSPEQVLGHPVDHRSDLFSLGVTLYELATGRHPFAGATATETMDRILHTQPEPIARPTRDIQSELERIALKCLEKDRERRYQSARELLGDLRALQYSADAAVTRAARDDTRHHNLPAQLTSFIGRDREIAEVQGLVSSSRLVTLTGAGGCGKTRLGLAVAAGVLDWFPDGIWAVDFAPVSEPALVTQTVASVLDVRESQSRSLIEVLSGYLRHRNLLLLLDNCEHLIAPCAALVETLLRAAPKLHVVATSREALGVDGEVVWRVPSLSLPDPGQPFALATVSQCEAMRLLVDRARLVQPAFAMTETSAGKLAEICRRLDGIPLAIELAAAKLKVLSVEQIHSRLEDRFRLLTGGSRTALARQRTLEAAMNWSYELLSDSERRLLCRLSVFPGGWTLEAAEEVCAGNGIARADIVDLLSHLADKSLVVVEDSVTGDRRYRFLETVRQYGRERLVLSGEIERLRDLHSVFFSELARRAEPELRAADQVAWLNRLRLEHDNLRAALEWWLAVQARRINALELAAALWWFWARSGHFSEGQQWLERALAGVAEASPRVRLNALIGLWHMTFFRGDYATTVRLAQESLTLARDTGDTSAAAFSLFIQANVALEQRDLEKASRLRTECEVAAMASADVWYHAIPLFLRAWEVIPEGDYDRACELIERAVSLWRQLGDKWATGIGLANVAALRFLQERRAEAAAVSAEGVRLCEELTDRRGLGWFLEVLAAVEGAEARFVRAARLWGAAEAHLEGIDAMLPTQLFSLLHDPQVTLTRASLGETSFRAAWSEGRAMSMQKAVQYALTDASHDHVPDDGVRRRLAE